jgi:hypothetical protein
MMGFLLGTLSVWLVDFVKGQYTREEMKLSLLLMKRAKKNCSLIVGNLGWAP